MLPKLNPDYSNRVVREQKIPDHFADNLPSEEDMWLLGDKCIGGWSCKKQYYDPIRYVHRCADLVESGLSPPILEEMRSELDCHYIAMFASDGVHTTGSLNWHIDGYHVFAFNIEGVTEWEWFDLETGQIQSIILEPKKNMITVPSGVSHRVKLITDHRMSLSIIREAKVKDLA